MTSKKIARLTACKLKGHTMGLDGRCRQCFFDYWANCPISSARETKIAGYDAMMEALDC